jgi:hypothetical protein
MTQTNSPSQTGDIGKIIQETEILKSNLVASLSLAIPSLLEHALRLERHKDLSCTLSNSYPVDNLPTSLGKTFEVSYMIYTGKIYRVAYDPTSHCQDTKESHTRRVSKKEFLNWVKKSNIHALDVYEHLIKYIKAPALTRPDMQTVRELHMKFI